MEKLPSEQPADGELVARVPREGLKSLFYVLAGKPDSLVRIFRKSIIIEKRDLLNLHSRVAEKLRQHHVEGLVASVNVSSKDGTTKEFSSWADFEAHRWDSAAITDAVTMRWDFMLKLPHYEMPQRHTLTVRISEVPSPAHLLHIMSSHDPDEHSAMDYIAPVLCRVDFINALLSQELVNIVSDWDKSLSSPPAEVGMLKFLRRRESIIHQAFHHIFQVILLVCSGAALWYFRDNLSLFSLAIWIVVTIFFVDVSGSLGHWVGVAFNRALASAQRSVRFLLTNGDHNREEGRAKSTRRKWVRLGVKSLLALILNILGGLVVAWLVSG